MRHCILGHIQQGGAPSPLDRINATLLAAPLVQQLEEQAAKGTTAALCCGLVREKVLFTPLDSALAQYDLKLRRPKQQFWMEVCA